MLGQNIVHRIVLKGGKGWNSVCAGRVVASEKYDRKHS